jgi:hypothetical protein
VATLATQAVEQHAAFGRFVNSHGTRLGLVACRGLPGRNPRRGSPTAPSAALRLPPVSAWARVCDTADADGRTAADADGRSAAWSRVGALGGMVARWRARRHERALRLDSLPVTATPGLHDRVATHTPVERGACRQRTPGAPAAVMAATAHDLALGFLMPATSSRLATVAGEHCCGSASCVAPQGVCAGLPPPACWQLRPPQPTSCLRRGLRRRRRTPDPCPEACQR